VRAFCLESRLSWTLRAWFAEYLWPTSNSTNLTLEQIRLFNDLEIEVEEFSRDFRWRPEQLPRWELPVWL